MLHIRSSFAFFVRYFREAQLPAYSYMNFSRVRLWADYGGVLNAGVCAVHCAAGPFILAFWGVKPASSESAGDLIFLLLSGILVAAASGRLSTWQLRLALWTGLALFAATVLLADRYPVLEYVQYAVSFGLMGVHLLNLRYCRRCQLQAASRC
jgi:hypothetical protein